MDLIDLGMSFQTVCRSDLHDMIFIIYDFDRVCFLILGRYP